MAGNQKRSGIARRFDAPGYETRVGYDHLATKFEDEEQPQVQPYFGRYAPGQASTVDGMFSNHADTTPIAAASNAPAESPEAEAQPQIGGGGIASIIGALGTYKGHLDKMSAKGAKNTGKDYAMLVNPTGAGMFGKDASKALGRQMSPRHGMSMGKMF